MQLVETRKSAVEAASDRDDVGAAEALLDFARRELDDPVRELAVMATSIASDASLSTDDHRADLESIRSAARQLAALTAELALRRSDDPAVDWSAAIRQLRHDLRTPITAILGYGDLVAEEAAEQGLVGLVERLGEVLRLARQILQSLDRLSSVIRRDAVFEPKQPETGVPGGQADVAAMSSAAPGRQADGDIRGRVLVVDDNPAMRDLVSRWLVRHGHDVVVCDGGEAALDLTADGGFDLVMLDLLMPGIDGLEVLTRLRERPAARTMPVIVMSALNEIDAAVRCIEAGADDYLSKPIDDTLLRARIGSSLERKFLRDRERETLDLLRSEQQRSEMLLRNILPASVVERLRSGESVIADQFEEVTVMFCDIVGFTALAARLRTAETLQLLGDIFSRFDALADRNGLEKIKTIGDAYMVVGGIPDPLADSARRVLAMAVRMADEVRATPHGALLDIRIGIHTGPAAGGIIGTKKFFYDVWGDTVNMASRLEASCEPGRVHVSAVTAAMAGTDYDFKPREPLDLPGKGRTQTYYLSECRIVADR